MLRGALQRIIGPRPRQNRGIVSMTTNHRRIALLAGASIAALGISAPVLAAPHDALADGTYPGATTTDDTIEICDLATPPGSPCFFGVIDTSGSNSVAVVNSIAS